MKKQKSYIQNKSGITLVALVVTIIVLLILAGVSLMTLTGENGIINKAFQSKDVTELAQIKEEVIKKWYELERETADKFYSEQEMAELFQKKLRDTGDDTAEVEYNNNNETFEISYKGYELDIQSNGKVTNNRE